MRTHAALGGEIVAASPAWPTRRPRVRHHHERCDGGGYPDGLLGDEIPIEARIVARRRRLLRDDRRSRLPHAAGPRRGAARARALRRHAARPRRRAALRAVVARRPHRPLSGSGNPAGRPRRTTWHQRLRTRHGAPRRRIARARARHRDPSRMTPSSSAAPVAATVTPMPRSSAATRAIALRVAALAGPVGRRRGRRPGGVREGLPVAAAVRRGAAVSAVAAGDRGERGAQPGPLGPARVARSPTGPRRSGRPPARPRRPRSRRSRASARARSRRRSPRCGPTSRRCSSAGSCSTSARTRRRRRSASAAAPSSRAPRGPWPACASRCRREPHERPRPHRSRCARSAGGSTPSRSPTSRRSCSRGSPSAARRRGRRLRPLVLAFVALLRDRRDGRGRLGPTARLAARLGRRHPAGRDAAADVIAPRPPAAGRRRPARVVRRRSASARRSMPAAAAAALGVPLPASAELGPPAAIFRAATADGDCDHARLDARRPRAADGRARTRRERPVPDRQVADGGDLGRLPDPPDGGDGVYISGAPHAVTLFDGREVRVPARAGRAAVAARTRSRVPARGQVRPRPRARARRLVRPARLRRHPAYPVRVSAVVAGGVDLGKAPMSPDSLPAPARAPARRSGRNPVPQRYAVDVPASREPSPIERARARRFAPLSRRARYWSAGRAGSFAAVAIVFAASARDQPRPSLIVSRCWSPPTPSRGGSSSRRPRA